LDDPKNEIHCRGVLKARLGKKKELTTAKRSHGWR